MLLAVPAARLPLGLHLRLVLSTLPTLACAALTSFPERGSAYKLPAPARFNHTHPPLPPRPHHTACSADQLWQAVASRLRDLSPTYSAATTPTADFPSPNSTEFLSFSPVEVAGLTYDRDKPMWGTPEQLADGSSNLTCTWWMYSQL